MAAFIVRRAIGAVIVLFFVSVITFLIFIVVPGGDPAERMAGKNATDENIANIRKTWGFDQPVYMQYAKMMQKVFTGDLISYSTQQNVTQEIKRGLPATFSLAIGAAIIWLSFGILARYYLGPEKLGLFPDGQYVPLTQNPIEWFYHLILPWFVLAVLFIGFYGRVLRSNILDSINEDYVRTARAKGLSPRAVLRRHVLRNSLIPIVTLFALDFAGVLGGGAILTETVFDLNGVGQFAARSVRNLDLPPIMAVTLLGAFFIVTFNALVDFFYAYLDPRIRPS